MHSRREARRHFEAIDDCRHQSHFAAAQPPRRSEYPYSHTTYLHGTSVARKSSQDLYTSGRSQYEGSQGRPFDNNVVVLPFAPDPRLLGTVTLVHFGCHQVETGMLLMEDIGHGTAMTFQKMRDILRRRIGCRESLLWISSSEVGERIT
jgi:hypothetical protein